MNDKIQTEIMGEKRDNYGRETVNPGGFNCYESSEGFEDRIKNSDLNSTQMDSTEALERVKDHLEMAIGHTYFEVDEIRNEEINGEWRVEVKINYLFRDKEIKKRFKLKKGVITSVETITSG